MSTTTFWFENPDFETTITDGNLLTKFKQLCMESEMNLNPTIKYAKYDKVLSNYTNAYVIYVQRSKLRGLINAINKQCNLNIDSGFSVVKFNLDNTTFITTFIFASLSTYISRYDNNVSMRNNSVRAQQDYLEKQGVVFTFIIDYSFYSFDDTFPIFDELVKIYDCA